jgi:hypothetical protein
MAWSPVRRINAGLVWVEAPGDYATLNSNHLRDGTGKVLPVLSFSESRPTKDLQSILTKLCVAKLR